MTGSNRWQGLKARLQSELGQLATIHPGKRRWHMAFAAALALGLPILIGAYFGHLDYGLVSSLGGLVFLYLPNTPLSHRMVWLLSCGFGLAACYTLGLMSHFVPPLMMWVLSFIAIVVTMVCRFYAVGPPGSLFFIMAAAIGAYSPGEVLDVPLKVGLLTMGALLACLIAFFYSLGILRLEAPDPVVPRPRPTFDFVVFDSIVIGSFVGASLAVAQALQLDRPYWVPVSCLAVLQGMTLRAVWTRQIHRVLGTAIGLLLSWGLLSLLLDPWRVAWLMIVLAFVVESTITRHYGFAVIFITPLAIILAEAATFGQAPVAELIEARFLDTVVGCLVGFGGGICLHSQRFRRAVGAQIRRLAPSRLEH